MRYYNKNKKTLTKKYLKEFLKKLEYVRDTVYEGRTIEYSSFVTLASLMDIDYDLDLIYNCIKKLEDEGKISYFVKRDDKLKPPYCHMIDVIPF